MPLRLFLSSDRRAEDLETKLIHAGEDLREETRAARNNPRTSHTKFGRDWEIPTVFLNFFFLFLNWVRKLLFLLFGVLRVLIPSGSMNISTGLRRNPCVARNPLSTQHVTVTEQRSTQETGRDTDAMHALRRRRRHRRRLCPGHQDSTGLAMPDEDRSGTETANDPADGETGRQTAD